MSDTSDLDALAREYLALWQDHLRSIAGDPETMRVLTHSVDLMNAGAQAFARMTGQGAPFTGAHDAGDPSATHRQASNHDSTATSPTASGAEAPAAASCPADMDCAQLASRIAALEDRLDRLERAASKPGAKSRAKPSRRRS